MIDRNENIWSEELNSGATGPASVEKLKEKGKKAYTPLLSVLHKYRDHFTPYLDALSHGLRAGAERLEGDVATEADRFVSRFFRETADGVIEARQRLSTKELSSFTDYVVDLANRKPGLMFGTSYFAGLFVGRLSRHVLLARSSKGFSEKSSESVEPPFTAGLTSLDQSIH
jgi:hypothetical protein